MEHGSKAIQSVERAMAVLETLSAHGGAARLTEVAEATGFSKSTVHGVLDTLIGMGYVTRDQHRYALGLRLEMMARPLAPQGERLRAAFAPALRAFNELCGEDCFLAVPCGTRAYLTLDALDGEGHGFAHRANERRDALATSAIGKVFLAHHPSLLRRLRRERPLPRALDAELAAIGEQGFAFDLQTSETNLNCFALPLRLSGRTVAALGASGPPQRLNPALMRRLAGRTMRELFNLIKC